MNIGGGSRLNRMLPPLLYSWAKSYPDLENKIFLSVHMPDVILQGIMTTLAHALAKMP